MSQLDYTVLVTTYNRPDELARCLRAALRQDPAPAELLVIDDGALDEGLLRRRIAPTDVPLRIVRKDKPGSVASLNLGGRLCRTPWMLILDDDIYLDRNFMRELLRAFEGYPEPDRLAALAGYPILSRRRRTWRSRARLAVERFFLLKGRVAGRFLPSSYFTDFESAPVGSQPWRVEFIPGGVALWRTRVYRALGYDRWFSEGYAYGADMELSYRCTRRWHALGVPTARALHDKSPASRIGSAALGRQKITNQHYFFLRHFARSPFYWLCYLWATAGHIGMLTLAAATAPRQWKPRLAEVAGMIGALLRCLAMGVER